MNTEINTVGQAYTPNPHRIPMLEDTTAVIIKTFSATMPTKQNVQCLLK